MEPKKKYAKVQSNCLRMLLESKVGVLLSNWCFQGMLYMEPAEVFFKVLLECFFWGLAAAILSRTGLRPVIVWCLALIIAHTANWLFNGHLFVLGRYLGFTHTRPEKFIAYPLGIKARLETKKSVAAAAMFGSLSRDNFSTTSDLDMRIIYRRGVANSLVACFWGFMERFRALLNSFPLDVYVIRKTRSIKKLRPDEPPVVLFDHTGFWNAHYERTIDFEAFRRRFLRKYVQKK